MRVLFVTSKSFGGSGKHISVLSRGISKRIYCDLIYFPSGVTQDAEIEEYFANVFRFTKRPSLNPFSILSNISDIIKLIRLNEYDIVHSHTSIGGVVGRLAAFFSFKKIKTIHTIHAFGADEHTPLKVKWIFWIIEKILDKLTYLYISPSKYMIDYGCRIKLINKKKAIVIYNSLPFDRSYSDAERQNIITNLKQKHNLSADDRIFLFCGRLDRQKGVDILIHAMAKINFLNIKLIICGTGDQLSYLKKLSMELNVSDNIIWVGWQANTDQYYIISDYFIMPSRWESFGLVFLEAMFFKLPIIATNVQGIPEVVKHRLNGILVPSHYPDELDIAMSEVINNLELSKSLGSEGHSILKNNFNYNIFISDTLKAYYSLINN
jgi:glycosyltransferase involved in cell wall biosynthesis